MVVTTYMIHQIARDTNKEQSAKETDIEILESFLKSLDKFDDNQKIIS